MILDDTFEKHNFKTEEMNKLFPTEENSSSVPSFIAEYENKIKNKK